MNVMLSTQRFTLLTNHGAALAYRAAHPDATLREVGDCVGITERAAARVVRDLRVAGYLAAAKNGRGMLYVVDGERRFVHKPWRDLPISVLIDALSDAGPR